MTHTNVLVYRFQVALPIIEFASHVAECVNGQNIYKRKKIPEFDTVNILKCVVDEYFSSTGNYKTLLSW